VLVLRDVRIKMKRVLPSLFLAQIITKRKKLSNKPEPIQSQSILQPQEKCEEKYSKAK
jgi:hypothetical protein